MLTLCLYCNPEPNRGLIITLSHFSIDINFVKESLALHLNDEDKIIVTRSVAALMIILLGNTMLANVSCQMYVNDKHCSFIKWTSSGAPIIQGHV